MQHMYLLIPLINLLIWKLNGRRRNWDAVFVIGPHSKRRKSTRDKAKMGKSEVNRGRPPLTANHISTDSVENSLGPSVQDIPLGISHNGGFNAMFAPVQQGRYNYSRHLKVRKFYLQNLDVHLSGDRHFSKINMTVVIKKKPKYK